MGISYDQQTKYLKTIFTIAVCISLLWFVSSSSHKDEYVMRDGCVYHYTQDWNGISIDGSYTLTTCDSTKFRKYQIIR